MCVIECQESHPEVVFQKRVHPVKRPARPAAGDGDILVTDNNPQLFVAEVRGIEASYHVSHQPAGADIHVPVGPRYFGHDWQRPSAGLLQRVPQLFRRVLLDDGTLFPDDDVPAIQRSKIHTALCDGTGGHDADGDCLCNKILHGLTLSPILDCLPPNECGTGINRGRPAWTAWGIV